MWQLPPRGCVLKHLLGLFAELERSQLPPRGCVLKPTNEIKENHRSFAAASARLCVETVKSADNIQKVQGSCLRAAVC